ncbi:MAG: hypothetical protein Q7S18_00540 [bacterium]|nr:hypothetical protein [bacterium]
MENITEEKNQNPQNQGASMREKTRLNIESFSFLIFIIFAIVDFVVLSNYHGVGSIIQKYLLVAWVTFSAIFLYKNKKFHLFGDDNLPAEEATKLTKLEKVLIWIFSIISPAITGLVTLFIWYKKNPFKARRAGIIAMIVFSAEVFIFCASFLGMLVILAVSYIR